MKKAFSIIVPVLICFLVGSAASFFQQGSLETWYPALNKSALTPPGPVFGIAWGILYLCMGVSIGLVLNSRVPLFKEIPVLLFVTQLGLNFLWSFFFFRWQNPMLALIDIVFLLIFIIFYAFRAYPLSKWAAFLMIPYALWVGFASYLNWYVVVNN